MKIIHLDSSDDIVSVSDRLAWAEERQVLFVVPEEVETLTKGLDLVRLQRLADRLRVEVGLVVGAKGVRQQALALGIPSFATVEAARRSRRGWWRGRRRRESVGLSGIGATALPEPKPFPRGIQSEHPTVILNRWLWRYIGIAIFFIVLALATILFLYYVPRATLTLHPETEVVQTELQLTADPDQATTTAQTIPARRLTTTAVREGELTVSGGVTQADHDRLLAQTTQFLQVVARESLAGSLIGNEFLVEESVQVVNVSAADFSHEVGQVADRLTLRLEAEVGGTAVSPSQATTIGIAELQKIVPDDFDLALDTVSLMPTSVVAVDEAGRVTFGLLAEAQAAAVIDLPLILEQTEGQETAVVRAYLFEQLPLRQPPELTVWPTWFGRLPYVAERVETAVVVDTP
ncbi:MAG: hypothetical protein AAF614_32910 [Chloroflexota bacterium]